MIKMALDQSGENSDDDWVQLLQEQSCVDSVLTGLRHREWTV